MSNQKPKVPKNNKFGGMFLDSDDEHEVEPDSTDMLINYKIQEKYNPTSKNFKEFINNPDYITTKGDDRTNIVDRYSEFNGIVCAKMYCIPENKIARLFKFIECCRLEKSYMMLCERQQEYSGIMLDFDIPQRTSTSYLDVDLFRELCRNIAHVLHKYIDLEHPDIPYEYDTTFNPDDKSFDIFFVVIKKPQVKFKEKLYYKDGFHVLIPGIKIKREVKRFIIDKINEEDILYNTFKRVQKLPGHGYETFLDKNSAHVPVYFLGSSTKFNEDPYELSCIFKCNIDPHDKRQLNDYTIKTGEEDFGLIRNNNRIDINPDFSKPIVLCQEFSLNWEVSNGVIKKKKYEIREAYSEEVSIIEKNTDKEKELDMEHGMLSIVRLNDPDADFIEEVLNTLRPSRYTDYDQWFKVLCVLAHTSRSYKPLAEKFSMKCTTKYSRSDFDQHWQSALVNKNNVLTMGSLHYWAKLDNPVKYEEVKQRSITSLLYKKIYDMQIEGLLGHNDIAQLLYKSLKHKYAYDTTNGGVWYEFITADDQQKNGEIYKWRICKGSPNSIKRYISEILPNLFDKIFEKIDIELEKGAENKNFKYLSIVKHHLKTSCRKLRDNGFKTGVVRESEQLFDRIGFTENLDKNVDLMGVGNGVLKLGKNVEFVTGYHNYYISMYTKVEYKPFNPYDETTKKLLIALRNIFPDDETDTFEFIMCYFASALDGKKKESLLLLMIGGGSNGKSFLTELVSETIDKYCVKMPVSFLTSRPKNSEGATPALMMLEKARLARYSETEKSEVLHLAKVKEITGQETLGGRKNYGDFENFKPASCHIATSNYDFEVNGTDHGTWRRLKRVHMKIKFCKQNVDSYDPNNKYERLADPSMGSSWPDNDDVKTAFLGILCFYYELLQNKYGGLVENVPHYNVKIDTEKYRDDQDKINNYINSRVVKTADPEYQCPIPTLIEKYISWHRKLYPGLKDFEKSVLYQFENSKLIKSIRKSINGSYIEGYRALDITEELEEGDKHFMDEFTDSYANKVNVVEENAEQFYKRICRDYESTRKIKQELLEKEIQAAHIKKMESIRKNLEDEVINFEDIQIDVPGESSSKGKYERSESYMEPKFDNGGKDSDEPIYDKAGFKIKKNQTANSLFSPDEISGMCLSDESDESDD